MLYRNYAALGDNRHAAQSLERYFRYNPGDSRANEYRETIEQLGY